MLRNGDIITIDLDNGSLTVDISDAELAGRKQAWQAPQPKVRSGYLARYARMVTSASTGAVVRVP